MSEFEPFPVLEQTVGLFNARANWQSPMESWRTLTNFFINNGRLTCRSGQVLFGGLYPAEEEVLPGTMGGMLFFNLQITPTGYLPIHRGETAPSTYRVTITDGVFTAIDNGLGAFFRTDTMAAIGAGLDYNTGVVGILAWPGVVAMDFIVTLEWEAQRPVVGIHDFFTRSANEYLVALDTHRMYLWSEVQRRFNQLPNIVGDIFTGGEFDYFWFVSFDDRLILCNGVDVVYKYEPLGAPPHLSENPTNFDGAPGNDISTVQMGVRHKGILHYLHPIETGVDYPQRARRTKVGDPTSFRDAFAYTDAPTDKAIVGAVPISDSLIVFFERNETWRHRFTGDPKNPYSWERISRERGSWTPFGTVEIETGALTLDGGGLVFTEGQRVVPYRPEHIENFPFQINSSALESAYGVHYPERLEAWITVPTIGEAPDAVMVINTNDGVMSKLAFQYSPRVLGFYRQLGVLLWDEITGTWDQNVLVPDEVGSGGVGDVILLGGGASGEIFSLNTGVDDAGVIFSAAARTQFFNPFGPSECHFGYVDLYVQPYEGAIMRLKFYRDRTGTPYHQVDVSLTRLASESQDTVIRRISVNQIADSHAMEIELTLGLPGWKFYGAVYYLKPAGRQIMRPK